MSSGFASGSYVNSGSYAAGSDSAALAQYALPSYTNEVVGSSAFSSAPLATAATLTAATPIATARTLTAAAPIARRATATFSTAPIAVAAAPIAVAAAPIAVAAAPIALAPANVPLNQDPNPIVIRKKPAQPVNYTQQISVKFLQPPPPQQPGDIVITQQKDVQAAPAPPHLIRQKPPLPIKPAPLVVRERPPVPPAPIAPEHHVIPGKVIPPPPRKVITERLPQLPQPPQDIIVERWLEYPQRTRRVVFRPAPKLIPAPAPKNVLIQWDSPAVALNRQFRNLGISLANPAQYAAQFGASLVHPSAIPALAQGVKPANGQVLAAESLPKPVRLVGDVAALSLINRAHPAVATTTLLAAPAATLVSSAPAATYVSSAPAATLLSSAPAATLLSAAPAATYVSGSSLANSAILSNSAIASGSHAYASDYSYASAF